MLKLLKECKEAKTTVIVCFGPLNADFFEKQMLYEFKLLNKTQFRNLIKESIFKEVILKNKC